MLPAPIPLALIDDHTLFRSALADMLAGDIPFEVVVQAAHGGEYLRAVQGGAQVAVAVVDLHMPIMDGFDTIAWMRDHTPGTRAIALSFDLSEEVRQRALKAGACGFLRKDTTKDHFLAALMQVAVVGQLPPDAAQHDQRAEQAHCRSELLGKLSQRELECMRLLCARRHHRRAAGGTDAGGCAHGGRLPRGRLPQMPCAFARRPGGLRLQVGLVPVVRSWCR